jgi:TrmH family RNA methyltransferase
MTLASEFLFNHDWDDLAANALTSVRNPLVKQFRELGKGNRQRREQGLFLLEGTHGLIEALAMNYPVEIVCFTAHWGAQHIDLVAQINQVASRWQVVSPEILAAMATTQNPDGVVAALTYPNLDAKAELSRGITESLPSPLSPIPYLGLALESIQDPGNMGTLVRSAVAVGTKQILLSADCVDITNPKVLRATVGQWFRCDFTVTNNFKETLQNYQSQGIKILATAMTAPHNYWEWDFRLPTMIVMGNEGNGLSEEVLALADGVVFVPLASGVESLNVGVCGSLLLYEGLRQRQMELA